MRLLPFLLVMAASATATAAATDHGYVTSGTPSAPRGGVVELASFGLAQIGSSELPPMQALHVRFTIANQREDRPWLIDLRDVAVVMGAKTVHPTFINADTFGLPAALIRRGDRRVFDLYFVDPLLTSKMATFEVRWSVETASGRRVDAVPLVRLAKAPKVTRDDVLGRGARWWCDPTYPWPLFHRRPGPIVHRPPTNLRVRQ